MLWLFGLRPDRGAMMTAPLFWAKLAFRTALALGALPIAFKLSRPGMPTGRGGYLIAVSVALV